LLALDARTGAVRWRYTYVGGTATAVVAGRVVVVAGQVDGLVGLDLRNGVRLWSRSGPHVETMVFAAGAVVTATTSAPSVLGAVAPTSGKLRWRRRFPLPPRALVAAGGRIVVCEGGSRLVLDGRTGRTVGAAELPCSYSSVPGAPKLALDRRGPGGVIAVDPVDGRELWRVFELRFAPGDLRAVSSGAAVYLPWKDETTTPVTGGVEAYDAATGAALWRVDLTGGVSRRPAVAGGTLVVAGDLDCSSQPCTAAVYGLRR
jgi:outer membrane protein assembly factor BamB